jgi:hypothetical protein
MKAGEGQWRQRIRACHFWNSSLIRRRRASLQCRDQFGRGEDRVGGRRPVELSAACIISCEKAAVASVTRVT